MTDRPPTDAQAMQQLTDFLHMAANYLRANGPEGMQVMVIAGLYSADHLVINGVSNAECPKCLAQDFSDRLPHGKGKHELAKPN